MAICIDDFFGGGGGDALLAQDVSPYKIIEELQAKIADLTADVDRLKKENMKLQMALIEAKRIGFQSPPQPIVGSDAKPPVDLGTDSEAVPMTVGMLVEIKSVHKPAPVDNSAKIADLRSQLEAARADEAKHRKLSGEMTSQNARDISHRSDKIRTYSNSLIEKANSDANIAAARQKTLMTQIAVLQGNSKQNIQALLITAKQSDGTMLRLVADSKLYDIAQNMKKGKKYQVTGIRRKVAGTEEILLRSIKELDKQ